MDQQSDERRRARLKRRVSKRTKSEKKKKTPAAGKELPAGVCGVLGVLLQAQVYAQTLKQDVWEFALELPNLCARGLSINDLRWLTCMGYVKHAEEINSGRRDRRAFRSHSRLTFTQCTCFVLTPVGTQLARKMIETGDAGQADDRPLSGSRADASVGLLGSAGDSPMLGTVHQASLVDAPYGLLPNWDSDRRELRLGGILVKRYKLPSSNQETVLAAFEEEGWPRRIDDPLPPVFDMYPKRRLDDTIKRLNLHQKSRIIRFMGDGCGAGVLWELMSSTSTGG